MVEVASQSSRKERGGTTWWLFFAPVVGSAVVVGVVVLLYMGGSDEEPPKGEGATGSSSNDEDAAEEVPLQVGSGESRKGTQDPSSLAERRMKGDDQEARNWRQRREPRGDAPSSSSSEEIDWELEMADSEEVVLTPEAIAAARERFERNGGRVSPFLGPDAGELSARMRKLRRERRAAERAAGVAAPEAPPHERGAAGAGPG